MLKSGHCLRKHHHPGVMTPAHALPFACFNHSDFLDRWPGSVRRLLLIAESTHLFGKDKMRLVSTSIVGTNTFGQQPGREQAIGLDNSPLAMNPLGLNRVEPGTLLGQEQGKNAHTLACSLHLLVLLTNPGADFLAGMPGGILPDQQPGGFALLGHLLAAPLQELSGDITHGAARHEAQRHLPADRLACGSLLPEHANALGSGSAFCQVCSIRRKGCSWSCQPYRDGSAKRLHQTSSRNPIAQLGCRLHQAINRSRAVFFPGTGDRGC